ncbi:DUF2125 domain-containing protein [Parvibaculaceae bacterium PLY_AMNH_Bact1]|nr:DUF2125 domain-containing protein [Parvibaculaceae bacterium PLY_AMNH_Bact1]
MSRLPEPMKNIRWSLILPFVLIAVGAIAYSLWWAGIANRVEAAIVKWQADQAANGIAVSWNKLETGGYPYRIQVDIAGGRVEAPDAPRAWAWEADALSAQTLAYRLNHVIVDIPGNQRVHYSEPRDGAEQQFTLNLTSNVFWASYVDESSEEQRLSADIQNLSASRARQTDNGPVLAGGAAAGRLQLHGRPAPEVAGTAFDIALKGQDISWVDLGDTTWAGSDIAHLEAQTRITDLPPDFPDALATLLPDAAAKGTKLAISEFALEWGPIEMTGRGEVKLDSLGRPEGRFQTSVGNLDGLIDALVSAGIVSQQSARLAFAGMVALSSLQGEETGRVRLPVAMKEGVLFLGPIAAARLEPLY